MHTVVVLGLLVTLVLYITETNQTAQVLLAVHGNRLVVQDLVMKWIVIIKLVAVGQTIHRVVPFLTEVNQAALVLLVVLGIRQIALPLMEMSLHVLVNQVVQFHHQIVALLKATNLLVYQQVVRGMEAIVVETIQHAQAHILLVHVQAHTIFTNVRVHMLLETVLEHMVQHVLALLHVQESMTKQTVTTNLVVHGLPQ